MQPIPAKQKENYSLPMPVKAAAYRFGAKPNCCRKEIGFRSLFSLAKLHSYNILILSMQSTLPCINLSHSNPLDIHFIFPIGIRILYEFMYQPQRSDGLYQPSCR